MTQVEFNTAKRKAEGMKLSPFAQFCKALEGVILFEKNNEVPRWEVWFEGCTDADKILNGQTKYLVFDRLDSQAIANQKKMY